MIAGAASLAVNYTEDMATTTTALVTTAQFLAQPENYDANGNRIKDELIGGEIVLMAPPSRIHDVLKGRINNALAVFLATNHNLGLSVYPDDRSALIHAAESVREVKGDQPLEDALLPGVSAPISRFFEGL